MSRLGPATRMRTYGVAFVTTTRRSWIWHCKTLRPLRPFATNPYVYEPRAMLWAGVVEARLGRYEDAIRSYTRAISAAPRYTPAYLNRGLAYMNVGRYEQAIEDFDMILRQDPHNDQAQKYRELAQQP